MSNWMVVLVASTACFVAACSGTVDTASIVESTDGGKDLPRSRGETAWYDEMPGDVRWLLPDGSADNLNVEVPSGETRSAETAQAGEFGAPCHAQGDCLSGWCLYHFGEEVCSQTCVEECPAGWTCKDAPGGPDGVFVCLSDFPSLCLPCSGTGDCPGAGDRCVSLPEGVGAFCGGVCNDEKPCPAGYSCDAGSSIEGDPVLQCVPLAGICDCSEYASGLGLGTACSEDSAAGTCWGWRSCGPEGLSACSAEVPEAESCDGADNDCDGLLDEGMECDDEEQCTLDECAGADGCVNTFLADAPCFDGDLCTYDDHCVVDKCSGTPLQCGDGNPCTLDDCDEGVCSNVPGNDGQPCEDGDPCTLEEQCVAGECIYSAVSPECLGACGDGLCVYTETAQACAIDCGPCGDGVCGKSENALNCPGDCMAACGDGLCQGGEGPANCLVDCSGCGDAFCGLGESPELCPGDCPPGCGNGECEWSESAGNCPADCQPACGNGLCEWGENPLVCAPDCALCGDGLCSGLEDVLACASDCATACGNGLCQQGETPESCAVDCGPCGDGICGAAENAATCMADCAVGCGDGVCLASETESCPADCVVDQDGDGVVNAQDNCPTVPNPLQENLDGDEAGDACDPDDDGDGDGDVSDCAPLDPELHHGALDFCDGVDNDCSGAQDDGADCSDGVACTLDLCEGAAGCAHQPTDGACDDANACTNDSCLPESGCAHSNNTVACNDGNKCTTGEKCSGGACVGGSAVNCNDNNVCTNDSCVASSGCKHVHNSVGCNDGNKCTTGDKCSGGSCKGGAALNCNDNNVCTTDSCVASSGCKHSNNSASCNDGNSCTVGDHCAGGTCHSGSQAIPTCEIGFSGGTLYWASTGTTCSYGCWGNGETKIGGVPCNGNLGPVPAWTQCCKLLTENSCGKNQCELCKP